jgi:hypothetical protein
MGMPGKIISKGAISAKADAMANYPDAKERQTFLEALEDPKNPDYADILIVQSTRMLGAEAVTQKEAAFLRSRWFNRDGKGWWQDRPDQPALEWTLRQSLIQAMKLAAEGRTTPLPVDSYWICGVAHLQVTVARNNNQVTRIILTPGIREDLPIIPTGADEDIWVIRPRHKPLNEAEIVAAQDIHVSQHVVEHVVETVRLRQTE